MNTTVTFTIDIPSVIISVLVTVLIFVIELKRK